MDSPPGVTTIWRILTRVGVVTPETRKRPKRSWLRFGADLPNQRRHDQRPPSFTYIQRDLPPHSAYTRARGPITISGNQAPDLHLLT